MKCIKRSYLGNKVAFVVYCVELNRDISRLKAGVHILFEVELVIAEMACVS